MGLGILLRAGCIVSGGFVWNLLKRRRSGTIKTTRTIKYSEYKTI